MKNSNILGITIFDQHKIDSQCADDIWAIILNRQDVFDELLNVFDEFYEFSGLKINYEKAQILHIGTNDNNFVRPISEKPLKWVEKVRILGIDFVSDTEKLIQLNVTDIVKKIDMLMQAWSSR